jgi:hypothetical protein
MLRVRLLRLRHRDAVPAGPVARLVTADQDHSLALRVEHEQQPHLRGPAEPGRSSLRFDSTEPLIVSTGGRPSSEAFQLGEGAFDVSAAARVEALPIR